MTPTASGRRRRRHAPLMGMSGRRRHKRRGLLGFGGFSFGGILEDIMSVLTIGAGFLGGAAIYNIASNMLTSKDATSGNYQLKFSGSLAANAITYGLGYLAETFLKPSGNFANNAILGIKIAGLTGLVINALSLVMTDIKLDTPVYSSSTEPKFSFNGILGVFGWPLYDETKKTYSYNRGLLGDSYLVQDGEVMSLSGRSRNLLGYSGYQSDAVQRLDNQINSLVSGTTVASSGIAPVVPLAYQSSRL
jgi:hypothetical protein